MVLRLWDSSFRFYTPYAYVFLKFHCGGLSGISAMSRTLERMWGETEIMMLESAARLEVDHPPLPLVLLALVPSLAPLTASLGQATGPGLLLSACLLLILKHFWASMSVCVKASFHIIQRKERRGSYLWRLCSPLMTSEHLWTDCSSHPSTQKSDSVWNGTRGVSSAVWPATVHMVSIFNYTSVFLLEKAMATHSSTLAWKIPWTEKPGRLQSMGLLRVGHDWATSLSLFTFMHWRRKWQPTPVFLPEEFQGRGSLLGCHLWGRTESDTTEVT